MERTLIYEGPRITWHRSCSHLVIPGLGLPFPVYASRPALLTLGVKPLAEGCDVHIAATRI